MKSKKKKGEYGYRNYHRKMQLGMVLFGALMILVQLGARNFTDNQAAKNILTVMAMLSVLPTANIASPLIASWKYRTPAKELWNKSQELNGNMEILYDLILTSKEQIIPADVAVVHPKGVFIYCPFTKTDEKKAEKYLNDTFRKYKLDPHVKIIKDENSYFRRLKGLKPASEYEDDGSVSYTVNLLKNLSM